MSGITKVRSSSKTDLVVEKITESIMAGEFGPGEFLPNEEGLCRDLGVSRSILREATRVLAYRGLLEIRQGRGTVVRVPRREVSEESLSIFMRTNRVSYARLMEVRRPVEIEIARLAAGRRDETHLAAMRESMEKMARPGKDFNLAACVRADGEFHQALLKATDNPLVEIIINSVLHFLHESRMLTLRVAGFEKATREHRAIYEAVKAKDAELAATCMEKHMASTWSDLMQVKRETGDE
jgi:DNA-binding FadR family transcriptional regulator